MMDTSPQATEQACGIKSKMASTNIQPTFDVEKLPALFKNSPSVQNLLKESDTVLTKLKLPLAKLTNSGLCGL